MVKIATKLGLIFMTFLAFLSSMVSAGSFMTASKPACTDVVLTVKGKISYKDSMKSGELGYHHCMHRRLSSSDFPVLSPNNNHCAQVDMQPEVVGINPPLPHEANAVMPVFQRPNPYYIPDGTACEVKYAQYYYLRDN